MMKRLLHPARSSNFEFEPATDRVDQYGRLLRYVIRASDGHSYSLGDTDGGASLLRSCACGSSSLCLR